MGQVMNSNSSKENNREDFPIARNVNRGKDCLENLGSLTVLQVIGKRLKFLLRGVMETLILC